MHWEMRYTLPDRSWSNKTIYVGSIPLQVEGESTKDYWKRVQRNLKERFPEIRDAVSCLAPVRFFQERT